MTSSKSGCAYFPCWEQFAESHAFLTANYLQQLHPWNYAHVLLFQDQAFHVQAIKLSSEKNLRSCRFLRQAISLCILHEIWHHLAFSEMLSPQKIFAFSKSHNIYYLFWLASSMHALWNNWNHLGWTLIPSDWCNRLVKIIIQGWSCWSRFCLTCGKAAACLLKYLWLELNDSVVEHQEVF